MHRLSLLLLLALFTGCPTIGDDDDIAECPVEDRFTSDPALACTANFCGLPEVYPATGSVVEGSNTFRLLEDGDVLPVWWGPQGGYHVELAVQTINLCSVIYIDFGLYDVTDGGEEIITIRQEALPTTRHVQAVPVQDGDPPSLQRWWTEQFRLPCSYWPDDPDRDPPCEEEQVAFIEDRELLLRIATRDHNLDREAVSEVRISAECCQE